MSPPSPSLRAFASPLRIHQQEKERSTPHVCGSDRDSELLPTRQYSFARPRSFLLAPDTYAVRVTGDFKAAPGLTTARNDLSAFGGFARLRLTHLPLSGESPTIYQQEARLGIFLAVVACPEQAANRASSWSRRQESNPRQADYRSAVLPLNYTGFERAVGIEPTTSALEGRCSTAELHPHRAPDSGRSLHLHLFSGIAR